MRRLSPCLPGLVLLLASCDPSTGPERVRYLDPFWLRFGTAVVLPDGQHRLTFAQLLEDSRCPSSPTVDCISAGRVRIIVTVSPLVADAVPLELRLLDEPSAVVVGQERIELLGIDPPRRTDPAPPEQSYRARVSVSRVP